MPTFPSRRAFCRLRWGNLALLAVACTEPGPSDPCTGAPADIVLSPDTTVLERGQAIDLNATIVDPCGEDLGPALRIEYSAVPAGVVTVSIDGLITATDTGTVTVLAETSSDDGETLADSVELVVRLTPRVDITQEGLWMWAGTETTLDARITDFLGRDVSGFPLRWESSDPSIATIDESGYVQAHAEGTALLRAVVPGVEHRPDSIPITVFTPQPTRLVLSYERLFRYLNGGVADSIVAVPTGIGATATARVLLESGDTVESSEPLLWTSSAPAIVSVDAQGELTAVSPGLATIRVALPDGTLPDSFPAVATTGYTAVVLGFDVGGINERGDVVGRSSSGAMLWSNGVATSLGDWYPWAVNSDRLIVGSRGYFPTGGPALTWRDGVLDTLPYYDGCPYGAAFAVDESGTIVGGFNCGYGGARWRDGVLDTLGTSYATDINEAGQILAGAHVLTEASITTLTPPAGWTGWMTAGLNDAGWVVGWTSRYWGRYNEYEQGVGVVRDPNGTITTYGGHPDSGGVLHLQEINNAGVIVGLRGTTRANEPVVIHPGQMPIPLGLVSTLPFGSPYNSPRHEVDINSSGQIAAGNALLTPIPF